MKLNARFYVFATIIILGALTRVIPHIPNVTAITAIALFGAAQFNKKITAFLVTLSALILSDAILGFYGGAYWVYGTFMLITLLGLTLRNRLTVGRLIGVSVLSSVFVFVFTDIGVWLGSGMYAHTLTGLVECYTAALPFLRNEVLGDLFYTSVVFGSFYFAQRKFPALAKVTR